MHARRGHGPAGKASLGVSHNDYGTEPKEPWPRGSTAGLSLRLQTKPNPTLGLGLDPAESCRVTWQGSNVSTDGHEELQVSFGES